MQRPSPDNLHQGHCEVTREILAPLLQPNMKNNLPVTDKEIWRVQLQTMMTQWHFSIQQIEQFMIKTIEDEIKKSQNIK
jgi:hypothetical protein